MMNFSRPFFVVTATLALHACNGATPPQHRLSDALFEGTIDTLHTGLNQADFSCEQVVRYYLDRIDAYDTSTGLNAITVINPDALKAAKEMDKAWTVRTIKEKPLACVPVLIKDNIDTVGLPTTGGSEFLANKSVRKDATIFRRLKDSGAIMIAKTNMAEWAFSPRQTISGTYGVTANAYDLTVTPAGSSGGTASGVAANFAMVGIGTDTGNSVRGPSSHTALVGLRPTLGVVSRAGIIPLSFDRDTAGPMTRTVKDAAYVMSVISGEDDADTYTTGIDTLDYLGQLKTTKLSDLKIGVLENLTDPKTTHPEITAAFNKAVSDLSDYGADVQRITIQNFDALAGDGAMFCARFGYDLTQYLLSRGTINSADGFSLAALADSKVYGEDALVPGGLEYFSQFPDDMHPKDWERPCMDYAQHPERQKYKDAVLSVFEQNALDVIVYPSWAQPPAALNTAHEDYAGDNNQIIAPATGLPAVTVPMGYSESGLPLGLQMLGLPYSDAKLLSIAYAYEQVTTHRKPPKRFPNNLRSEENAVP